MTDYIDSCEENLLHVYNRFPVVFDHGQGMYMYDTEGKEYLDFASGIGVMAFGHSDAEYLAEIKDQVDTLLHTSNLYYHTPLAAAAESLAQATGLPGAGVFFTNSGAEAVEGAIKAAKKYAYLRDGFAGHEIIAMGHSFHGRTVGALSVTGNEHYRDPFLPLMEGVRYASYNNYESIVEQLSDKTCAIIMETVQGEGGIYPADPEFLNKVRSLCDERDIILILDEIQCGMGRTGSLFAYQQYGVLPDIVTSAKALGGGVPVGAFVVNDKVRKASLVPGDHGTTYGGNPLVCRAVSTSIRMMKERKLPEHVKELEGYFAEKLDELVAKYDIATAHRGMGFMQGLVVTVPVGEVVKKALLDEQLIILSAGSDVVRMLPPLIADKADIDEAMRRLDRVLSTF